MSAPIAFLLGFLCAFAICFVLVALYYMRAKRRVRAIRDAFDNHQKASKVVGSACDKVYAKQ
jgi:hypothetical protein